MQGNRFLRDHQFDEIVKDIRLLTEKLADNHTISLNIRTINVMYETLRIALERIEEALDHTQTHPEKCEEIRTPLKEVSHHIRTGLTTLHGYLEEQLIKPDENIASIADPELPSKNPPQ